MNSGVEIESRPEFVESEVESHVLHLTIEKLLSNEILVRQMALCFSRRKRKKNRKDRHLLMMKVVSDVSRRTKNVQLRS